MVALSGGGSDAEQATVRLRVKQASREHDEAAMVDVVR
jgi:hypothetical protein